MTVTDHCPAEVELILSALEAGRYTGPERRGARRQRYRVRASLHLFSDAPDAPPRVLFGRDVDPRSFGFITPDRLPLGYGGWIELPDPQGKTLRIRCTLSRCRQCAPGWFEGSLSFTRAQDIFAE